MIDEDCPRGPLAGRKALHTSFDCGIDEVLLDEACWILLSGNEREHSVHTLQDSRQLLRVLVICLDPCHPLGGRASRSILCRLVSCNDPAFRARGDNMTTILDRSKISCFLAATRASMISCATSAEPLTPLQTQSSPNRGGTHCQSRLR